MANMVDGPDSAELTLRLSSTSESPRSPGRGGVKGATRPARTAAGCPHEPHTCYVEARNAVFCGACGDAAAAEEEGSGSALPQRVSQLLEEAEALQQELSVRRRQASAAMAEAPAFSELEAARQAAKTQVDDILLAMVKHVEATRKRLHQDIDACVAERAARVTALVRATNTADTLLQDCERQLVRSEQFSPAHAVAVQQSMKANVDLFDQLASLSAKVSAPFELQLRRQYSNFDLSGMRVVSKEPSYTPPSTKVPAAAAAVGNSSAREPAPGDASIPSLTTSRPRGSTPRWEPGSPSPLRFTTASDVVSDSPESRRIFEQTGRSLLHRLYQ